ncbi:uncharacterized protein [Lepeophtheirus salmonis]
MSHDIQDMNFGGSKVEILFAHERSMVFRGKMSGIIGMSREMLKEELSNYLMYCRNDLPDLDLLNLTPFNISTPDASISVQQIRRTSICKSLYYYDRVNFPNSNRMTWKETREVCNLISGVVSYNYEKRKDILLWTDMKKEWEIVYKYFGLDGKHIVLPDRIHWEEGQPNGGNEEECLAYSTGTNRYLDLGCDYLLYSQCEPRFSKYFQMRGLCKDQDEIESEYYIEDIGSDDGHTLAFTGFEKNNIFKYKNSWVITSDLQKDKILGFYNGSKEYPVGRNDWYITGFCSGEYHVIRKTRLILSKCNDAVDFTCNNGDCITLNKRCNEVSDCTDGSDEESCKTIWVSNYRKEFPPAKMSQGKKFSIQVELFVLKILSIDEKNNKFSLKVEVKLRWQDVRVIFFRLSKDIPSILTEEEKNLIWVPMIYFENSVDSSLSIVVDRQSEISSLTNSNNDGHLTDLSHTQESIYFPGESAYLYYKRRYDIVFYCHFKFEHYPFDSQICKIETVLPYALTEAFEFELADGKWTTKLMDSNLNGLQFNLLDLYTSMDESTNKSKIISYFRFKRIYRNVLTTVFVPTLCLQIIVLLTLHITEERFNTVVMVTLTAALATYTLYQSISNSLPSTHYIKMIDNWLLFSLLMPFVTFFVVMWIERFSYLARNNPKNEKSYINHKNKLIFYGKFGIVVLTAFFDIVYWYVNLCVYYTD